MTIEPAFENFPVFGESRGAQVTWGKNYKKSVVYVFYIRILYSKPRTEELGLEIMTTAKFSTGFTQVPVHIRQVFTGAPKLSKKTRKQTESPSFQRSIRKSDRSGDPNSYTSDLLREHSISMLTFENR